MEQLSTEWFQARCGSLGASKIRAALEVKVKGGRMESAINLMYEIAAERLTGVPARRGDAARWGLDHEDEARRSYAFLTNLPVIPIALIPHPTIPHAHASPDSLVGDDGGLEIKCPTSATHLKTLIDDAVPKEHLPQIHWSMACSGRSWWDFVSYDPRFPAGLDLFVRRVERDETTIARMEAEANAWLAELDGLLEAVKKRAAEAA
jgi:putative phage-type endonuclease